MSQFAGLRLAFKALYQLGPRQTGLYALYKLGIRSGHIQRQLNASLTKYKSHRPDANLKLHSCIRLPDRQKLVDILGDQIGKLYEQADEITNGNVRLFGGQSVPLILTIPGTLENWNKYESGSNRLDDQDIKFIWEPGRFGWASTLARAYYLSGNEQYADVFWQFTERFFASNPPYLGPHWTSAQEVSIRLVSLSLAIQIFIGSIHSTPERIEKVAKLIAIHAERIPPTLVYARSQNNNHLITEALGLYTASALLSGHPKATRWHQLGWKWLKYAFQTQISSDGTYIQHSTNYHRMMLQAALWTYAIHETTYSLEHIPAKIESRLAEATKWIWQLLDLKSGRVPNLGHNDGAYILPLTVCSYQDYRPVIYGAARRFLHINLQPIGPWSEMTYWLSDPVESPDNVLPDIKDVGENSIHVNKGSEQILHNPENDSWVLFRVPTFKSRPAHADQLHVDLWWSGVNLAQDPGTYLYNSSPPWDNSLTSSLVHNTVTVDGQEFMLRAGRFLYLNWAEAKVIPSATPPDHDTSITATHNGYRKLGLVHARTITALHNGNWEIIDRLTGSLDHLHTFRLHWLLPDWEYEISQALDNSDIPLYRMRNRSPHGWISLSVGADSVVDSIQPSRIVRFQLVRAGKLLFGSGESNPISGWASPTYGEKIPALACILEVTQSLPVELKSLWILPDET